MKKQVVNSPLTSKPFANVPQFVEATAAWKAEFHAQKAAKAAELREKLKPVTLKIQTLPRHKVVALTREVFAKAPSVEVSRVNGGLVAKVVEEAPTAEVKKAA